jgi:transposase
LAREFEPSAASIAGWVRRGDAEHGGRSDVMPSAEREELARPRSENRQLRQERDISAKGRHWSAIIARTNGGQWPRRRADPKT